MLAEGISIPSSYTAHLAPLSSSKLYNEARSTKNEKSLETPYVVMFQAVNILSGTKASGRCGPQIQECWEFEHPRRDPVLDSNGMYSAIVAPLPNKCDVQVFHSLIVTTLGPLLFDSIFPMRGFFSEIPFVIFSGLFRSHFSGLAGYFEAVSYGTLLNDFVKF